MGLFRKDGETIEQINIRPKDEDWSSFGATSYRLQIKGYRYEDRFAESTIGAQRASEILRRVRNVRRLKDNQGKFVGVSLSEFRNRFNRELPENHE